MESKQPKITRVLLVDDKIAPLSAMEKLLKPYPSIQIIGKARTVQDALNIMRDQPIDLLFTDIRMDGKDFALLDEVDQLIEDDFPNVRNMFAVLVTAFGGDSDILRKSHGYFTLGLLEKPVNRKELERVIKKYNWLRWDNSAKDNHKKHPTGDTRIPIKNVNTNESHWLLQDEILWFEAVANYTKVYTVGGERITCGRLISAFEEELQNNPLFFRCHRSYMVRISAIKSLRGLKNEKGQKIYKINFRSNPHNASPYVSRRQKANLEKAIDAYWQKDPNHGAL